MSHNFVAIIRYLKDPPVYQTLQQTLFSDLTLFAMIFTTLKGVFKAFRCLVSPSDLTLYIQTCSSCFLLLQQSPELNLVCLKYSHLCFAPLRNTCGNNSMAHEVHRTLRCSLFPGMRYESLAEFLFDRYGLYEVGKHCWQKLFCHRETSVRENPGTCTVRWPVTLPCHWSLVLFRVDLST